MDRRQFIAAAALVPVGKTEDWVRRRGQARHGRVGESGYKCDKDTGMPIVSYSCADYANRQGAYDDACL